MEALYNKYNNITKCLVDYRGYSKKSEKIDFNQFKTLMKNISYVKETYQNKDKDIDIYILYNKNYTPSDFRKLLEKYKNRSIHILFFSKTPFNTYIKKSIKKFKNITYNNYLHKHFSIEINKGPLCAKHTIISKEEAKKLWVDFKTNPYNLKAILINDPQIIWIGGKIHDIIKITRFSEITGLCIDYRIVTPVTGKIKEATISERNVIVEDMEDMEDMGKFMENKKNKIIDDNEDDNGDDEYEDDEDDNEYEDEKYDIE